VAARSVDLGEVDLAVEASLDGADLADDARSEGGIGLLLQSFAAGDRRLQNCWIVERFPDLRPGRRDAVLAGNLHRCVLLGPLFIYRSLSAMIAAEAKNSRGKQGRQCRRPAARPPTLRAAGPGRRRTAAGWRACLR